MTPDRTIVTLEGPAGFKEDFELPLTLPLGRWKDQLLELLRQTDARMFDGWNDVRLKIGDMTLQSHDTLAEYAVWDGSILKVIRG